jgi:hypothetical protein
MASLLEVWKDWRSKYDLGVQEVPSFNDASPILRFLICQTSDPSWFRGTADDVIRTILTDFEGLERKWPCHAALYCLQTEIKERYATRSKGGIEQIREEWIAALDDLRLLFRFGPSDCNLSTFLWDLDHPESKPPTFTFNNSNHFSLFALLPPEGKVLVLQKLVNADQISVNDAQRFLFEFLPFREKAPFEEVELSLFIHARTGDVQRAWRCIEKWGSRSLERLLEVFVDGLSPPKRFETLANLPLTPEAVEILEKIDEELGNQLRMVRATF